MQVINKKVIVIFICLSIFIFGLYKLFNKEKVVLDDVKLDIKDINNLFAIYVEQSEAHYEEKDLIPEDGYIFNKEKSQCMSIDGNIINNILSYDYENKKLIVDTTESISCYLYFDKGAGLEIIGKEPKGLNLDIKNSDENWTGMYRFQGQQSDNIENYICFGTNDKDECLNNQDKYMYRIIGIEESGRIKVIKKEALGKTDQWWTDMYTSKHWNETLVFDHINHTTFLKNTELVPPEWIDKIDNQNWLFGNINDNNSVNGANQNGIEVYKIESGIKEAIWNEKAEKDEVYKGMVAKEYIATSGDNTGEKYYYIQHFEKWNETLLPHEVNAKIGLMNVSDYYLSVSNDANCKNDGNCNTGWIHFSQNDNKNSTQNEWTMTRYGLAITSARLASIIVLMNGSIGSWAPNNLSLVRPVFYLKNNLKLIDGNGKIDDPFIIN